MNQLFIYIHPLPLGDPSRPIHPTPLGHHRALSWAPCVIEQLPTSYLFYTRYCIYARAIFQSVSPSPSPLCLHIHFLHLRLYSCPENRFICTIFLYSIHIWYLFFSFWFTSLYMTDFGSIQVSTANYIPFLWLSNAPLCICIITSYSSVSGHLGCFSVLAIENSASVNIGVHVCVCVF